MKVKLCDRENTKQNNKMRAWKRRHKMNFVQLLSSSALLPIHILERHKLHPPLRQLGSRVDHMLHLKQVWKGITQIVITKGTFTDGLVKT